MLRSIDRALLFKKYLKNNTLFEYCKTSKEKDQKVFQSNAGGKYLEGKMGSIFFMMSVCSATSATSAKSATSAISTTYATSATSATSAISTPSTIYATSATSALSAYSSSSKSSAMFRKRGTDYFLLLASFSNTNKLF